MKRVGIVRSLLAGLLFLPAILPQSAVACAACFGRSDSPMAQGMNVGIFTLLVVILSVLAGIAAFFIYILRRAARLATSAAPTAPAIDSSVGDSQPISQSTQ